MESELPQTAPLRECIFFAFLRQSESLLFHAPAPHLPLYCSIVLAGLRRGTYCATTPPAEGAPGAPPAPIAAPSPPADARVSAG